MGKNQGFLSVNLSKARDNSTWAVSWLAELTVTPSTLLPFLPSSVCPSQKPPCVDSKRPRVYRHHAHMRYHMCAWCRYTRGRFECTHGGFFCVPSRATHHTTHTQHNTTHNTTHNIHTTPHGDRETQRQRQTETERDRERQRDTETRQDKKTEDETIKRRN